MIGAIEGIERAEKKLQAELLAKKGYIVPSEGKLKLDDLNFIAATALFKEYEESFLDVLPFLPTKEKGEDLESQSSAS